ncbi:MAG TPA: asparagine synthetase B, partial [Myxococcales bacterium]|nr:asparagine synthetase B [Myxococcales bacterium]
MCGICGDVDLARAPDAEAVRRMAAALVHRGPDAQGFFFEGPAALGHRRLSILDLEGGVQPMTADGVTLVFNGQAYEHEEVRARLRQRGHAFATRSDTEVVLRAYLEWGERFVEELHGMFAIAIWDGRARRLILARDRAGKKPLFFVQTPNAVMFASEIKAFFQHSQLTIEPDPVALPSYFVHGYVPSPQTLYRGVRQVAPATHI